MAIRTRDRSAAPAAPGQPRRKRVAQAAVPTMQRTVITTTPEGGRAMLKAGTPTPDWYTGKSDGRDLAEQQTAANVEAAAVANHPAEQPLPEGEAWDAYLKGLEDAARATGVAPTVTWDTDSAREAVTKGLDAHAADQELATLTEEELEALEALSPDDQALLRELDDDQRDALADLAYVLGLPVWVNDAALAAIGAWLTEHDVDPTDLKREVELNDDGTVTVHRFVKDAAGHFVVGNDEAQTEDVVITPHRPFPVDLETGEVLEQPAATTEGDQVGPDPLDPAEQALVEGSVETVLARVGDDQALAVRALAAEAAKGDKARSTLTGPLFLVAHPTPPEA